MGAIATDSIDSSDDPENDARRRRERPLAGGPDGALRPRIRVRGNTCKVSEEQVVVVSRAGGRVPRDIDIGPVLGSGHLRSTDRAAIAEQRRETVAQERERQKGERLRRETDAEEKAEQRQDREMAKENCERSKEIYDTYYNAPRLYKPTADGGREFLSAEETDALRAKAKADIDKWCG